MGNNENLLEEDCIYRVIYHGKLVLTNNTLTFLEKKGVFHKSYEKMFDIPLEEIEECYSDNSYVHDWVLRLRLKNDKEVYFEFPPGLVNALTSTYNLNAPIEKAKTDRWVNAIIQAKGKNKHNSKNPLELLKIRFAKGEITKEQYEEMKKVLEGEPS